MITLLLLLLLIVNISTLTTAITFTRLTPKIPQPPLAFATLWQTRSTNKTYIFGGQTNTTFYSSEIYQFDTQTRGWKQVVVGANGPVPVPDGRMGAAGFVAADSIGVECGFVFGGVDGSGGGGGAMGDIWKYDFIETMWIYITPPTDALTNPSNRAFSSAYTLDNNIYLFGGESIINNKFTVWSDLWKYDPISETYQFIAGDKRGNVNSSDVLIPRGRSRSITFGGTNKLLVFAGGKSSENNKVLNDMMVFDTSIGNTFFQWVVGGPTGIDSNLGNVMDGCGFTIANGTRYVFGGRRDETSRGVMNELWRLEMITRLNNDTRKKEVVDYVETRVELVDGGKDIPEPRYGHVCAVLPTGKVIIYGGVNKDGKVLSDSWELDLFTIEDTNPGGEGMGQDQIVLLGIILGGSILIVAAGYFIVQILVRRNELQKGEEALVKESGMVFQQQQMQLQQLQQFQQFSPVILGNSGGAGKSGSTLMLLNNGFPMANVVTRAMTAGTNNSNGNNNSTSSIANGIPLYPSRGASGYSLNNSTGNNNNGLNEQSATVFPQQPRQDERQ